MRLPRTRRLTSRLLPGRALGTIAAALMLAMTATVSRTLPSTPTRSRRVSRMPRAGTRTVGPRRARQTGRSGIVAAPLPAPLTVPVPPAAGADTALDHIDRALSDAMALLMRCAVTAVCRARLPLLGITRYVHERHDDIGSGALPVVIQGGLSANAWLYEPLRHVLRARGFHAVTSWEPRHGWSAPAEDARRLAEVVERVRRETGADKVQVVAHSKGGITARWYVEQLGGIKHVARVVTLGSPIVGVRRRDRGLVVRLFRMLVTAPAEEELHEGSRTISELEAGLPGFLQRVRRDHPSYRLTSLLVDDGRGTDGLVLRSESLLPCELAPDLLRNVVLDDHPATHCSIAALWRFNRAAIDQLVLLLAGDARSGEAGALPRPPSVGGHGASGAHR